MDILIFQVFLSFVIGGTIVALLSLIAEKVNPKISGIIISLPSTVAISLLFIAIVNSPAQAVKATTIVPSAMGITLVFVIAYTYLAQLKLNKFVSIVITLLFSNLIWVLFSAILIYANVATFFSSTIIYLILLLFSFYFLTILPKKRILKCKNQKLKKLKYSFAQKIYRFLFCGFFVAISVVLSKVLGAFWGGVMAVFPAAFMSTLVVYHWYQDKTSLFTIANNIPLGSIMFVVYGLCVRLTYVKFGLFYGTIIAYVVSLILAILLTLIVQKGNNNKIAS